MPAWTKEEDEVLATAVRLYGVRAWSIVACALRGRSGKQCRERYQHQLLRSSSLKQQKSLPLLPKAGAQNESSCHASTKRVSPQVETECAVNIAHNSAEGRVEINRQLNVRRQQNRNSNCMFLLIAAVLPWAGNTQKTHAMSSTPG
eukprot:SAG31_NODE_3011_length_4788_cov_5.207080_4_plen_146_part_00